MEFEAKRRSPRYLSHFARSTQKHKICDVWCCMTTAHSLLASHAFSNFQTPLFLLFRDEILGSLAMLLCSTNTAFRWFGCRVTLAPQIRSQWGTCLDVRGWKLKLIHQLVRRDQNDFGCQMTCTTNRKSQIGHFKGFHRGQWPQERRETSASSRAVQISPKWHSLLLVLGGKTLSQSIWRPKIPIDISERHYQ